MSNWQHDKQSYYIYVVRDKVTYAYVDTHYGLDVDVRKARVFNDLHMANSMRIVLVNPNAFEVCKILVSYEIDTIYNNEEIRDVK